MNTIVKTTTFNGKTSRGHKYLGLSCLGSQFGFGHSDPRSDLIPVHVAALSKRGSITICFFGMWNLFVVLIPTCRLLPLMPPFSSDLIQKSSMIRLSFWPFICHTNKAIMPTNSQQNRYLTRPAVHDPLVLDGHHVSGLHLQSDVVLLRVH